MKSATLCSGFEGVGVGMRAAGLHHVWGIEYDDQIASVARMNGFNTLTLNILDADPALFERVAVLHASPPCPNFSVAKTNGTETDLDIALARKTADFIEILRPKYFTLENVYQYRFSQSWKIISERLSQCGYWYDLAHVNFADYSVPQTRKRMIVRAVHNGFVPYLPKKEQWIGWYEAIEDLIPTLPASEFAPWQLARLPDEFQETFIAAQGKYEDKLPIANGDNPALTITANSNQTGIRAFISDSLNYSNTNPNRYADEPMMTVTVFSDKHPAPRAFIVDGNNENNFDGVGSLTIGHGENPVFTVKASSHAAHRAWLSRGRVVKMTPRALARFQSFPDSYILSGKNSLDCKGIGNAVPPLLMEKICKGLVQP